MCCIGVGFTKGEITKMKDEDCQPNALIDRRQRVHASWNHWTITNIKTFVLALDQMDK